MSDAAEAARLARSLLEEFHAYRDPDGTTCMTAAVSMEDFTARMNQLAAIERDLIEDDPKGRGPSWRRGFSDGVNAGRAGGGHTSTS